MIDKSFSLAHQVFEQIEQSIIKGDLPAGTIISETELSKEYGVSRTPIREALSMLEQEGLVDSKHSRIKVLGVSQQDLHDLLEIRILLEGRACAAVAENITDEGIEKLKDVYNLQEFYVSKGDTENISKMDTRFHRVLFKYCSRTYSRFLSEVHKKLHKYRAVAVDEKSKAEQSIHEHKAILEAVEAKDAERIKECVTMHVENAKKRMLGE